MAWIALAVVETQQAQQAEDQMVRDMNKAADAQTDAEIEAYNYDMASYQIKERELKEASFESAEDKATADAQLLVEANQKRATLEVQNLETIGGGQTADSIIAQHIRAVAGATRGLEENYQRGVTGRRRELTGYQRDKYGRRMTAVANINALPRSGKKSDAARAFELTTAAASGYATSHSYTKQKPLAKTKRRTVSAGSFGNSGSSWEQTGVS